MTSYQPERKEQLFVCVYRMNPKPPSLPMSAEALHQQHRNWLQDLADKNILVGSGPARDEAGHSQGAVIILRAASTQAAKALAAQEPNAREGQRIPEVIPWHRMWFED